MHHAVFGVGKEMEGEQLGEVLGGRSRSKLLRCRQHKERNYYHTDASDITSGTSVSANETVENHHPSNKYKIIRTAA